MRKPTWMRRLAAWTSGFAWASYLTRSLNKVVNRKTVVTFCIAEILVSCLAGYYFRRYKALVELLHSRSVIMGGCLIFRIFSATMGAVGAVWRKTRLTRYYWCFLLINTFSAFFIMCPFMRTKCVCENYWQCQALYGYMSSGGTQMLNPFPPPHEKRFIRKRVVPYVRPPVPLEVADALCQYDVLKCFSRSTLYPVDKDKKSAGLIQLNESFIVEQDNLTPSSDGSTLIVTAKCCKVLDHYGIVPMFIWGNAPKCWRDWWKRKDCDTLVGGQDAHVCESHDVEALVEQIPDSVLEECPRAPGSPKGGSGQAVNPSGAGPPPERPPLHRQTGVDPEGLEPHVQDTHDGFMAKYAKETMKFFDVTRQGISWRSSSTDPRCNIYKEEDIIHGAEGFVRWNVSHLKEHLENIQNGTLFDMNGNSYAAHFIGTIISRLSTCKRRARCGVVRAQLVAPGQDLQRLAKSKARPMALPGKKKRTDRRAWLEICLFKYPAVPRIVKPSEVRSDTIEVHFYKDRKKIKDSEREQTMKHNTGKGLMRNVLSLPTKLDAEQKLIDTFLDACRCKAEQPFQEEVFVRPNQPTGCQVFYDRKAKEHKSWCEISAWTIQACKIKGFKLYQLDPEKYGQNRWWSEELCRKSGCTLSYIGMPTQDMRKARAEFLKLDGKENSSIGTLLYGSDCKRWNVDDEHAWAYVGYDSVCPDRAHVQSSLQIQHAIQEEVELYVSQYRSSYICSQKTQRSLAKDSKDRCQVLNAIPLTALIVLTVLSIPMSVIVFKFLVRRCGDHFAIETQFDAYFSEDTDEDDFDVGGSSPMTDRPISAPDKTSEDLHLAHSLHKQDPVHDSCEHDR